MVAGLQPADKTVDLIGGEGETVTHKVAQTFLASGQFLILVELTPKVKYFQRELHLHRHLSFGASIGEDGTIVKSEIGYLTDGQVIKLLFGLGEIALSKL